MIVQRVILTFSIVFCALFSAFSQNTKLIIAQLDEHYSQAKMYDKVSLYGECLGELDQIIMIGSANGFEKRVLEASIMKAELFRKTQDFDSGIDLLSSLQNSKKYPELHVKKLGRLAALYAENGALPRKVQVDSTHAFINEGIEIAVRLNLKADQAGLLNELGFLQNREHDFKEGLRNLFKSAALFKEIGDEENEIGALINVIDVYVNTLQRDKFHELYPILVKRVESTENYGSQSKLYGLISVPYLQSGDTITALKWADKANRATVERVKQINSSQMAAFKVIHDTYQFKKDAMMKSAELKSEKNQVQFLFFVIIFLLLLAITVALIFYREFRLKRRLNVVVNDLNLLNDKYQILIVESNHRIKNNLQMIISMLEFTKKGIKKSRTDIIESISGKIQIISTLHKHLYVDIHNAHVDLDMYYSEIVKNYMGIGFPNEIVKSIPPLQIRSERIVYFGLILNEMLSNTLEHAHGSNSKVDLTVARCDGRFSFSYSDQSPHDSNAAEGTGTQLIHRLVERIGGANYTLDHTTGCYQFVFDPDL